MLRNKTVLVTGGTGSFGHFITHTLLGLGVKEVRVFSRDEKKQHDMRMLYGRRSELKFVIGDVRDRRSVFEAIAGVDVIFQAAALKQVPTCEEFPMEAVQTNVLGIEHLVDGALAHHVQALVMLSTDKAVKPVNVMGMTKALQERIVLRSNLSPRNHGTRFVCVRYGNVLGSRGSVVPVFRRQLRLDQRLTITSEHMTRFLLTLGDSVMLALAAAESARGGEVYVPKSPAARLLDVAAVLAAEAGRPLAYDVIGLRPGEKLNEILISEEELQRTEDAGAHYKIHPWWSETAPNMLTKEYCSLDHLIEPDEIAALIARADREIESIGVEL